MILNYKNEKYLCLDLFNGEIQVFIPGEDSNLVSNYAVRF